MMRLMLGCHPEVDHRYIALPLWNIKGYRIKSGCGQRGELKNSDLERLMLREER